MIHFSNTDRFLIMWLFSLAFLNDGCLFSIQVWSFPSLLRCQVVTLPRGQWWQPWMPGIPHHCVCSHGSLCLQCTPPISPVSEAPTHLSKLNSNLTSVRPSLCDTCHNVLQSYGKQQWYWWCWLAWVWVRSVWPWMNYLICICLSLIYKRIKC